MNPADYCDKAASLIGGDRAADHGDFRECHAMIAEFWSVYLGFPVSSHNVAQMMALLKLARMRTGRLKEDDDVDMIGYVALGAALRHTP